MAQKQSKPHDVVSQYARSNPHDVTYESSREAVKLGQESSVYRNVAVWSKNWIAFRYAALFSLASFLLITDIHCCGLLFMYDSDNIVYGLVIMGIGNLIAFTVLAAQARELVDDSKTADGVPWWCYGCTNSRCN
ncbi:hypothetical protein DCAR_0933493 [Daucus carota subsp. sativus]|uniref:Uncharacterized protein n=1 Tax=Daucus carota subsp. sativus TaxID=79200 RepID=A0A175YDI8_DAUCS|nr:PREDICTED: uncharacterized protein LOC108200859 [Daucus carota subsp. sativus]WOH13978.1 hypothetical protein DCAR_0933493 [Daucus carota subsp. sativus]